MFTTQAVKSVKFRQMLKIETKQTSAYCSVIILLASCI